MALILNQAQAEAVHSAMRTLNATGATLQASWPLSRGVDGNLHALYVRQHDDFRLVVLDQVMETCGETDEQYMGPAEFGKAYGLKWW